MSKLEEAVKGWRALGAVAPTELAPARLQLHYAAQIVMAVGNTLVKPRKDDSHTNLGWSAERGALVSRSVRGQYSAALVLAEMRVELLDEQHIVRAEIPLEDKSLTAGLEALAQAIEAFTGDPLEKPLQQRDWDMPDNALAHGAAFGGVSPTALREVATWFGDGARVLHGLHEDDERASEVRCWPHHFDMATLIHHTEDGSRTIGVGLSPGDAAYPAPYLYVTPWPYPESGALPALEGGGVWHTEGYTAALLHGADLVSAGDGEAQGQHVFAFLRSALTASEQIHASAKG